MMATAIRRRFELHGWKTERVREIKRRIKIKMLKEIESLFHFILSIVFNTKIC